MRFHEVGTALWLPRPTVKALFTAPTLAGTIAGFEPQGFATGLMSTESRVPDKARSDNGFRSSKVQSCRFTA